MICQISRVLWFSKNRKCATLNLFVIGSSGTYPFPISNHSGFIILTPPFWLYNYATMITLVCQVKYFRWIREQCSYSNMIVKICLISFSKTSQRVHQYNAHDYILSQVRCIVDQFWGNMNYCVDYLRKTNYVVNRILLCNVAYQVQWLKQLAEIRSNC